MNESDLLARALELVARARDGLLTEQWVLIRDAAAILRRQLDGREPTAREKWLLECGDRVARWLGPAKDPNLEESGNG